MKRRVIECCMRHATLRFMQHVVLGTLLTMAAACETTTEVRNVSCTEIIIWPNASDPLRADSVGFYDCSHPSWEGEKVRARR